MMSDTISVRLDSDIKRRLDLLAKQSRRSKSFLAAEAIAAYVEQEEWQLKEVRAGIADLDGGAHVEHDQVADWLRSWGTARERKAPE